MGNDTETTVPTSSLAPTSFDTLPWAPPLASRAPAPRVVPEPPRRGEVGGEPCGVCDGHSTSAVWSDEHWREAAQRVAVALERTA